MARLPKFATPQNYSLYFNCNQNCMNNSCITFILKFATIKINALTVVVFQSLVSGPVLLPKGHGIPM